MSNHETHTIHAAGKIRPIVIAASHWSWYLPATSTLCSTDRLKIRRKNLRIEPKTQMSSRKSIKKVSKMICWFIFISLPLKPYALTHVYASISIPNDLSTLPGRSCWFRPKRWEIMTQSLPTTLLDLEKKTIWVQSLGGKTPGNPSVSNFLSFIPFNLCRIESCSLTNIWFLSLFQRPHYFDKIRIQKFGTNILCPTMSGLFSKTQSPTYTVPCLLPKGHHILPLAHGFNPGAEKIDHHPYMSYQEDHYPFQWRSLWLYGDVWDQGFSHRFLIHLHLQQISPQSLWILMTPGGCKASSHLCHHLCHQRVRCTNWSKDPKGT